MRSRGLPTLEWRHPAIPLQQNTPWRTRATRIYQLIHDSENGPPNDENWDQALVISREYHPAAPTRGLGLSPACQFESYTQHASKAIPGHFLISRTQNGLQTLIFAAHVRHSFGLYSLPHLWLHSIQFKISVSKSCIRSAPIAW